jgi:metal iron transporter
VRRLLTRLLSLIPSVVVAVAVGPKGINTMLVASQVVLSVVLPFVIFPLVWLTSSRTVMRVRSPVSIANAEPAEERRHGRAAGRRDERVSGFQQRMGGRGHRLLYLLGGPGCECYVLITLMLGEGS